MSEVEYKKIGGWLYLLGFGLIGSCLSAFGVIKYYFDIFGTSNFFESSFATFYVVDFVRCIYIAGGSGLLFISFLDKSKKFPRYYKIVLAVIFLFWVVEILMLTVSPELDNTVGGILAKDFFTFSLWSIIWLSYLKFSKRAKGTFVN